MKTRPVAAFPRSLPILALAGLSTAAGGLHVLAATRHGPGAPLDAAFFWLVAAAQLTWALLLVGRPRRGVLAAGWINLGVVALWLASRTVGVPAGAHAGDVLAVGWSDTFAQVLGLLVVAGSAVLLRTPPAIARRWRTRPVTAALVLTVVVQLSAGATALDADAGKHEHAHEHAERPGRG